MGKVFNVLLKALLAIFVAALAVVGAYVAYMELSYSRISDYEAVTADQDAPTSDPLEVGTTYTALTYNIGFGAYSPDYTFFMDTGVMADGTPTRGEHGKAVSEDSVMNLTDGAISTVISSNNGSTPDFVLLQEVDTNSDRSYHINQASLFENSLSVYGAWYASNFHSAFLAYPIPDFHGRVNAGLLSFALNNPRQVIRRSYPIDESFPTKYFDLDRCFEVLVFDTNNAKKLILINSHMSAYDEGGTVRAEQLALLFGYMAEEYERGNYVIAGGDWNHALCNSAEMYPSEQLVADWVAILDDSELPEDFSVVRASNLESVASCRGDDIPYEKGVTYTVTVDGFIVSDNVIATAQNIDTDFAYSDHNPVLLSFELAS